MQDINFDLIGIFKILFKRLKFILLFTLLALVIGIVFSLIADKKYTSNTILITKNPLLLDRNFTFRNTNYEHKHYFAIPDDIDQVEVISKTDGLIMHLIRTFDLNKVYDVEDDAKLMKIVRKDFKFVREDTRNIDISYTHKDPKLATAIVKESRSYIESVFRNYFLEANKDVVAALESRLKMIEDTIKHLDLEIQTLRSESNNYSLLLPNRGINLSANSGSISAQSSAQLEQLKQATTLKDRMVEDRASYYSLINEYGVFAKSEIRMFYIIQDAYVPIVHSFPKFWIVLLSCGLGGLLFGSVLVLVSAFYKKVNLS